MIKRAAELGQHRIFAVKHNEGKERILGFGELAGSLIIFHQLRVNGNRERRGGQGLQEFVDFWNKLGKLEGIALAKSVKS